jgi:ABC-2 type transport system ATP-binding protein
MGNKSQLTWENTIRDSFEILRDIYSVPPKDYQLILDELVALLNLQELLPKMARNLSLGERAKCEFAAALLYRPSILFLDEPTLGLDVSMQLRLRDFIRQYHHRYQTTIIVTSHYMADIHSLCERVILINSGRLIFDGLLTALADMVAPYKLIKITAPGGNGDLAENLLTSLNCPAVVIEKNERTLLLRVRKEDASYAAAAVISRLPAADLTLEDPPIEAVIDRVYREGVTA